MSSVSMLSPGVFLEEIDKSYYTGVESSVAVGVVGGARKGPVGVPTLITSKNEMIKVFGKPTTSDYGVLAALHVLNSTNKLYYQRVCVDKTFAKAGDENDRFCFVEKDIGQHLNNYKITLTVTDSFVDYVLKDAEGGTIEQFEQLSADSSSEKFFPTVLNSDSQYVRVETNALGNLTTKDLTLTGGQDLDLFAKADLAGSNLQFISKNPDSTLNGAKIVVSPLSDKGYFSIEFYSNNELTETFSYLSLDASSQSYFETALQNSEYFTVSVKTPFETENQDTYNQDLKTWFNACVGTYNFVNGGNGIEGITAEYIIGSDISATGAYGFADPEALNIDLLLVPGWSDSSVITTVTKIVENRADCVYVMDPPFALPPQRAASWINGKETNLYSHSEVDSSFVVCYAPWGKVYNSFTKSNVWCPPSAFAAAVIANSMEKYKPWAAPAGLSRGRIEGLKDLEYTPSKAQRDVLYTSNINPFADFKTDGYCIWGQKTTQRIPSALDRLNVRLLLNYIKKRVTKISNKFVFESNLEATWNSWKALVNSELLTIKSVGGITNYKVVMGENITSQDISEHKMPGIIYIQPTEVAEFIPVSFVVYGSNINFEEQVN